KKRTLCRIAMFTGSAIFASVSVAAALLPLDGLRPEVTGAEVQPQPEVEKSAPQTPALSKEEAEAQQSPSPEVAAKEQDAPAAPAPVAAPQPELKQSVAVQPT